MSATSSVDSLFAPRPDRVHAFDRLMRDRVADSLAYLAEAAGEHLELDGELLNTKLQVLRDKPVRPEVFAAYYEVVSEIQEGELEAAQRLFDEILATIGKDTEFRAIRYENPEEDRVSRHYLSQIDTDPAVPFNVIPAPQDQYDRAKGLIEQTMTMLRDCSPDLHDEIDALLCRVMLGAGPTEKGAHTFDGASAPGLWGGILLNAIEPKDVVDMAQTLAHESCHNLLFGYCIEDKLVLNPDDERHASPLRVDPRPLDGIYHASFVLARMYHAADQIAKHPDLSPELKAKAAEEKKQRARNFYDGLGTLKEHADYTDIGRELMDAAEAYMDRATA